MKKRLSIGLAAALLALPSAAFALDLGVNTNAKAELKVAEVQADGKLEVKVQQVKGESKHSSDSSAGKGGKDEARAPKNVDGGTIKGEAKIKGEVYASSTPKERKNYGWGFLFKWFGSNEAGPVGFDAESTASMNAPAASRFESFLGKLSSMFGLSFNAKAKATTTAEVK